MAEYAMRELLSISVLPIGGALYFMGVRMDQVWKTGYPSQPGWYRCRIEGGEIDLYCKRCELTGKYHWVYKDGSYITEQVEYIDARIK